MGYANSLEAAGATVHEFKRFGSYQGDWWAKVTIPEGATGWIHGSYGSCSGCDAFVAEMGYESHDHPGNDYVSTSGSEDWDVANCSTCAEYQKRVADFGRRYLDEVLTQAEAVTKAEENLEWDMDATEMVEWLRANA